MAENAGDLSFCHEVGADNQHGGFAALLIGGDDHALGLGGDVP